MVRESGCFGGADMPEIEEIELPNTEELEEMRAKRFTKGVAITTAFYAVILAITALGGNNSTKEMLLAQQEASDQWSYYQAKNMRENLYKIQRLYVEADFLDRADTMKPETRAKFEGAIKKMSDEESRYATEKKEIEQEARKAERERDVNKKKNPYFEFAEVLLQVSIVMASIAILSTSRPVFYFSLVFAAIGAILSFNGFVMVLHLPFLN